MDEDDSHQLAKANVSVDDIVQKEVTNTEMNKFVCIEELSNENVIVLGLFDYTNGLESDLQVDIVKISGSV